MLTLKGIKTGEITLAFRKWVKPTVKKNGKLHTPVGLISILDLKKITLEEILPEDARKAGFAKKCDLIKILTKRDNGEIYRIEFKWIGEDPRILLREKIDFTEEELFKLNQKLKRWDNSGEFRPWTQRVLQIINDFPGKRAQALAEKLDVPKDWLKLNIRKLKGLGLTISLDVGYKISPRGKRVLHSLKE
jgi:hypothetical protein